MIERPPIRSIAILGGGLVGLCAALAFTRALPGASITIVDAPSDPAALADRLPGTLPGMGDGLAGIGIDDDALAANGAATHRLAQTFTDWRGDDTTWTNGYGETGRPVAGSAFHQHWRRMRDSGHAAPFDHFAPAAVLARAERFAQSDGDPTSPLSGIDHALRLDPQQAGGIFLDLARKCGIRTLPSGLSSIERLPDTTVAAIHLDSDHRIAADLFIDCSGPSAPLLTDRSFDDWTEAIPANRLLLASMADTRASPLDRYEAIGIGWRAWWPLRERTLVGLAYADAITSESRARRVFGEAGRVAEAIAIRPGRYRTPWQRNVLALGDAAVASGALEWTGLALALADIALALELLPARDFHPLELAEYNRRAGARAERLRDFLSLHYFAAGRRRGDFWQTIPGRPMPPTLAEMLAQYTRRGVLPRHEDGSIAKERWLAVLVGLNVPVAGQDPTLSADLAQSTKALAAIAASIAALPEQAPSYPDYLAGLAHRP